VSFERPKHDEDLLVDEVIFLPPKKSTLWVDDVLIYEPGN
jgi:hypothetical protein